jgi:hypothetical protein
MTVPLTGVTSSPPLLCDFVGSNGEQGVAPHLSGPTAIGEREIYLVKSLCRSMPFAVAPRLVGRLRTPEVRADAASGSSCVSALGNAVLTHERRAPWTEHYEAAWCSAFSRSWATTVRIALRNFRLEMTEKLRRSSTGRAVLHEGVPLGSPGAAPTR